MTRIEKAIALLELAASLSDRREFERAELEDNL